MYIKAVRNGLSRLYLSISVFICVIILMLILLMDVMNLRDSEEAGTREHRTSWREKRKGGK